MSSRPFGTTKLAAYAIVCALLAELGGCASQPVFPRVEAAPGQQVGVVNLLSSEVTNVHLGMTVFGNYDNHFANDWHLDQRAADVAKTLLERNGYRAVDVTLPESQVKAIRDGDDQTNMNYSGLTKDWTQTYETILEQHHLAALIILREERRYSNGDRGPSYQGFGIFSTMGKTPGFAILFVTATADVIGGHPPHRSIGTCYGVAPLDPSLVHVENFADIRMADLEPIRPQLETLLDKRIRFELASAGLLQESPVCVVPTFRLPGFGAKPKS